MVVMSRPDYLRRIMYSVVTLQKVSFNLFNSQSVKFLHIPFSFHLSSPGNKQVAQLALVVEGPNNSPWGTGFARRIGDVEV